MLPQAVLKQLDCKLREHEWPDRWFLRGDSASKVDDKSSPQVEHCTVAPALTSARETWLITEPCPGPRFGGCARSLCICGLRGVPSSGCQHGYVAAGEEGLQPAPARYCRCLLCKRLWMHVRGAGLARDYQGEPAVGCRCARPGIQQHTCGNLVALHPSFLQSCLTQGFCLQESHILSWISLYSGLWSTWHVACSHPQCADGR